MAGSTDDQHYGNRNTMSMTMTMTMPHVPSSSDATQIKNSFDKRQISVQNCLRSAKSVKQTKRTHVKNKSNLRALDEAFAPRLPSLMQLIASSHVPVVNSNPRMTHRRIVHGWW